MPVKKVVSSKSQESKGSVATSRLASARSKNNSELESVAVRAKSRTTSLSIPVYSLLGKAAGNMDLPKEIFGAEVNKNLLAQAMRIYLNNQKGHFGNTKGRGEVVASTRKIYKQKGTGRARHGAISAPIFVGGGIAMGPKYRKVILELPKKMKKAALVSALSQKLADNAIIGLSGLDKATGKTKEIAQLLGQLNSKLSALIVTDGKVQNAQRAAKNIPGVTLTSSDQVNILEIIRHQSILFTKEAVQSLVARVKGEGESQKKQEVRGKKQDKKVVKKGAKA